MKQAKSGRANGAPKIPSETDNLARQDEAMAALIKGINTLIAHAGGARLSTATKILHIAKEELVHWAVNMNFHETAKDQFLNQHLYDSGLRALGEFLARVNAMEDTKTKNKIIKMLGLALMMPPIEALGTSGKVK